jgi:hypothetical protein
MKVRVTGYNDEQLPSQQNRRLTPVISIPSASTLLALPSSSLPHSTLIALRSGCSVSSGSTGKHKSENGSVSDCPSKKSKHDKDSNSKPHTVE